MGRLRSLEVMLDEPAGGSYFSGDVLRGTVHLELAQPMDIKEVRVKCVGMCRVTWAHAAMDNQLADVTTEDEYYINSHITLYSTERRQDSPTGRMTAGEHNFRFEFRLPAGAPGSLESPNCNIRYWVKATVRYGRHSDVNTRRLTVNPRLDLNMFPSARERVELTGRLPVTSLFVGGSGIEAALHLEKTGFLCGEKIPVKYRIRNNTTRALYSAKLELKRVMHCSIHRELSFRTQAAVVSCAKLGRVGGMRAVEGEETSLRVPKEYPSLPSGCNLMKISYVLLLKIRPSMLPCKKLKLSKEITAGNIPFRHNFDAVRNHHLNPCWFFLPPPTYEEVMAIEATNPATSDGNSTRPASSRQPRHLYSRVDRSRTHLKSRSDDDDDDVDDDGDGDDGSSGQLPTYQEAVVLLSRCSPPVTEGKTTAATLHGEGGSGLREGEAPQLTSSLLVDDSQGRELQVAQEDVAVSGVASPRNTRERRSSQTVRCGQ